MPASVWVEIIEPADDAPECYSFEIILQAVNDTGWPVGLPRVLYAAKIAMKVGFNVEIARGVHELPHRLNSDLLSRCHIRLLPLTIGLELVKE